MPKLESQCDRPRDGPPWQLPMSITSIPHLGAKKKSVVPSAWHLPSVPVPGLTLSRCKSCLLTLICRRRSPPPPLLSSPPLAVENGSLGTASESTSRETPQKPPPPDRRHPKSPRSGPPPPPSVERAIWGFEPRQLDGVTGSTGSQASNMASPSICTTAISRLGRPWPTAPQTTRRGGMVRQTWNRRPPPPPEA